jgi:hypothetical protein|tara:strand:+ start:54 stop:251 length:198 start_codon:yes stop_codon:yes gene_type:complete
MINDIAEMIGKEAFGESPRQRVIEGRCVTCNNPVREFRDALSVKEHGISGMCQVCQDDVFGGGEE